MEFIDLGPHMRTWINSLYSVLFVKVRVNRVHSAIFLIPDGMCQVCPLYPLILILTSEPFLRYVRANPNIGKIMVGCCVHKIFIYADNLLFFLSKLDKTLPNFILKLTAYGDLSNFHINFQKPGTLHQTLSGCTVSFTDLLPFLLGPLSNITT